MPLPVMPPVRPMLAKSVKGVPDPSKFQGGLSYKEISRVSLVEPTLPFAGRKVTWSPPAYANRHIFARNGKELICASLAAKP